MCLYDTGIVTDPSGTMNSAAPDGAPPWRIGYVASKNTLPAEPRRGPEAGFFVYSTFFIIWGRMDRFMPVFPKPIFFDYPCAGRSPSIVTVKVYAMRFFIRQKTTTFS